MNRLLRKLLAAQHSYEKAVGDVQHALEGKVDFLFSVIYHDLDGWCVLDITTARCSPFTSCVEVINQNGRLSLEDFNRLCI